MQIDKMLSKFNSKYGIYAINGNHELINGMEREDEFIENCNIKLLRDTSITIAESIQIIGREDRSIKQFSHKDRKPLSELIEKVIKNKHGKLNEAFLVIDSLTGLNSFNQVKAFINAVGITGII